GGGGRRGPGASRSDLGRTRRTGLAPVQPSSGGERLAHLRGRPDGRGGVALEAEELDFRPLRPADRPRVLEITARVWEGTDYLPHMLDRSLADPAATLEAAELDGVVVGCQGLRPITQGVVFYEGLRIAEECR